MHIHLIWLVTILLVLAPVAKAEDESAAPLTIPTRAELATYPRPSFDFTQDIPKQKEQQTALFKQLMAYLPAVDDFEVIDSFMEKICTAQAARQLKIAADYNLETKTPIASIGLLSILKTVESVECTSNDLYDTPYLTALTGYALLPEAVLMRSGPFDGLEPRLPNKYLYYDLPKEKRIDALFDTLLEYWLLRHFIGRHGNLGPAELMGFYGSVERYWWFDLKSILPLSPLMRQRMALIATAMSGYQPDSVLKALNLAFGEKQEVLWKEDRFKSFEFKRLASEDFFELVTKIPKEMRPRWAVTFLTCGDWGPPDQEREPTLMAINQFRFEDQKGKGLYSENWSAMHKAMGLSRNDALELERTQPDDSGTLGTLRRNWHNALACFNLSDMGHWVREVEVKSRWRPWSSIRGIEESYDWR